MAAGGSAVASHLVSGHGVMAGGIQSGLGWPGPLSVGGRGVSVRVSRPAGYGSAYELRLFGGGVRTSSSAWVSHDAGTVLKEVPGAT